MTISFALFCIMVGIGSASAADVNTTQCNRCLVEDDFGSCVSNVTQNCTSPATDSCFSAIGRYKFDNGSTVVLAGASRGCIACPNATEGCKNYEIFFNALRDWTLQDCSIVCCKGDFCNNQTVSLPTSETPSTMSTNEPTTAGHQSHYSASTAVLAIATIIVVFLF